MLGAQDPVGYFRLDLSKGSNRSLSDVPVVWDETQAQAHALHKQWADRDKKFGPTPSPHVGPYAQSHHVPSHLRHHRVLGPGQRSSWRGSDAAYHRGRGSGCCHCNVRTCDIFQQLFSVRALGMHRSESWLSFLTSAFNLFGGPLIQGPR